MLFRSDGKSINEALFCDDFLSRHKIIYTNGVFFTPDGRVTDELPLRSEIFDELRCCAVSNVPRKISNIVDLMKLAALVEDFPPETDRIHLANGTLFLDSTFTGRISCIGAEGQHIKADRRPQAAARL